MRAEYAMGVNTHGENALQISLFLFFFTGMAKRVSKVCY